MPRKTKASDPEVKVEAAPPPTEAPTSPAELTPEQKALRRRLRDLIDELERTKTEHDTLKAELADIDGRLSTDIPGHEKRALRTRKDAIRFRPRELGERMRLLREQKRELRAKIDGS